MEPFLKQVVKAYTTPEQIGNLAHLCFVFPSTRAMAFFRRHLIAQLDELNQAAFLPEYRTMESMLRHFVKGTPVERDEAVFVLYRLYADLLERRGAGDKCPEFDRFRFWGEMVRDDFNDVDAYLADGHELFHNLRELRQIQADYLTQEQKNILRHFWGDSWDVEDHGDSGFWIGGKAYRPDEDPVGAPARFLGLWEVLAELYDDYHDWLRKHGQYYSGMGLRQAYEAIKDASRSDFGSRHYVFVGFSDLTTSHLGIFQRLQELGVADFCWDWQSPAFFVEGDPEKGINWENPATRIVGRCVQKFHTGPTLKAEKDAQSPTIHILGVPSAVGQTKVAGAILDKLLQDGKIARHDNALDTCVIPNDPGLLVNLLHAIPEDIRSLNITVGMPIRHSSVATLVSQLISLQLRARRNKEGQWQYYYADIMALLAHPYVRAIGQEDADKLGAHLSSQHLFTFPAKEIITDYQALAPFFASLDEGNDRQSVHAWLTDLLANLLEGLERLQDEGRPIEAHDRQTAIIIYYNELLERLNQLAEKYHIDVRDTPYLKLLDRLINAGELHFAGIPLKGLQIMALSETRDLDFENLIIMSMNEYVFPRKKMSPSFIPQSLRHAYGLNTVKDQEAKISYAFYRLLSRADRTYLLYDSRTGSLGAGEMSRYLYQLKYLQRHTHLRFSRVEYPSVQTEGTGLTDAEKDPAEMARFCQGGDRQLSASALKDFKSCGMKFYYRYICRLGEDTESAYYIDEMTSGTIIHGVLEDIYKEFLRKDATQYVITADTAQQVKDMRHPVTREPLIDTLVRRHVNMAYCHIPEGSPDLDKPLTGETQLVAGAVRHFVIRTLEEDSRMATQRPLAFRDAEYDQTYDWELQKGLTVRFNLKIDRIDYLPDTDSLRFIDYKTGISDQLVVTMNGLFSDSHKPDAVFQLMCYCCAYADCDPAYVDGQSIQPMIYKLSRISVDGLDNPITLDKAPLLDFHQRREEFMQGLVDLVSKLLDPDEPFTCSPEEEKCQNCSFKRICGAYVPG